MTDNPFAALLRDVPRFTVAGDATGPKYQFPLVRYSDVLAALAAAVPADLAEAGKVLDRLREMPTYSGDPKGPHWTPDTAADLITALLASLAAQEAQIKGMEAADLASGILLIKEATTSLERLSRAEAAETALAAEQAKTAKLVDLLCLADEAIMQEHGCFPLDRTNERQIFLNDACTAIRKVTGDDYAERKRRARAAITEAGQ